MLENATVKAMEDLLNPMLIPTPNPKNISPFGSHNFPQEQNDQQQITNKYFRHKSPQITNKYFRHNNFIIQILIALKKISRQLRMHSQLKDLNSKCSDLLFEIRITLEFIVDYIFIDIFIIRFLIIGFVLSS